MNACNHDMSKQRRQHEPMRVIPSFFGFGLYWAWLWLLFFTTTLIPADARSIAEVGNARCLGLAVEAVVFLALVVDLVRKDPLAFMRGVDNTVACALGVIGSLGIIAGGITPGDGGLALYGAGWVLWGIAGAFLTLMWGRILDSLDIASIAFYLAGSTALGAILVFSLTFLPSMMACAATLMLPAASTLLAHRAKNVIRSDAFHDKVTQAPVTDSKIAPIQLLRILAGTAVYSAAMGVMLGILIHSEHGGFDGVGKVALLSPVAAGAAIMMASRTSGGLHPHGLSTAYRLCMPLVIAGFLILVAPSAANVTLASAIAIAGFQAFDAIIMTIIYDGSRHYQNLSVRAFLMGRFANVCGLSAGWILGNAAAAGALPFGQEELYLTAIGAVALASSTMLLEKDLFPKTSNASDPAPTDASPQKSALDPDEILTAFAKSQGLSAQETRVFMFLAKGHSRKTIQEKLFIASATVDTHIAHIYRKMEIHSRQELIDAAEAALNAK